MITLYSVTGAIEGDTDLYGKKASDLGTYKIAKSGEVTGSGLYVTGYTGFNGTDANEQEGFYFPISFTQSQEVREAYMQVVGSKNPPVKMDAENVIYLGKTAATAKKKQVEITHGDDRMVLTFEGCAFTKSVREMRGHDGSGETYDTEKRPADADKQQ